MSSIGEALILLLTGMMMVFLILWLVTLIGKLVINITNRFSPKNKNISSAETDKAEIAAIVAAVDVITGGRGVVDSIEKNS